MKRFFLPKLLLLCVVLITVGYRMSAQTYPFSYTGGVQTWTVPAGVFSINVDARGAIGGWNSNMSTYLDSGGHGARVVCSLAVTPGQVLNIYVGGKGNNGTVSGATGGFNGGGNGAFVSGSWGGGAGGGATDIRIGGTALTNRVVVAGGGGGAGLNYATFDYDKGGDGGGTTGETGWGGGSTSFGYGGMGGSPTTGGTGGTYPGYSTGSAGTSGVGGAGASSTSGGGGGGGYWGGGGGSWAGGGGGSSYAGTGTSVVTHTRGYNTLGNGSLTITAVVTCTLTIGISSSYSPTACGLSDGSISITGLTPYSTDTLHYTIGGTPVTRVITADGSGNYVLTGLAAGAYNSLYVANSAGCSSNTIASTVLTNPAVPAVTGPDSVCMGSTGTLSDWTPGGTWSSSTPSIATVNTVGVITPVSAGSTIITYYLSAGCSTLHTVTISPLPSLISGLPSVCVASNVTLTDSVSGGTWSIPTTSIATINSSTGIATGVGAGIVLITYSLPTGCYRTYPLTVNDAPTPIFGTRFGCPNTTAMLTDGVPYGTWTSSDTTVATINPSTGFVTERAVGVTIITYNSCSHSVYDTLRINPIPSNITGTFHVCVGSMVYLHDSTPSGIWFSNDSTSAAAAADFGTITGRRYGIDTITYMAPDGCITKHVFTVDSLPLPIMGVPHACPNSITSLADATPSGIWKSQNTTIATVDSIYGTVTGHGVGVDSIFYTVPTGCKVVTPLTINPIPPAITGDTAKCAAGIIDTLYDAAPGGRWTSQIPSLATIDSISGQVTTVSAYGGFDVITYTLPTGCYTTKGFTVHPLPVPHVTYDAINGELHTDTFYVTYQWYDSSTIGLIHGATSPSVAALYDEIYYVRVTDTFGCVSNSVAYINVFSSVNKIANNQSINVYPNPASTILHIDAKIDVRAIISTVDGKTVLDIDKAKDIDVNKLANGLYFIILYDENGTKIYSEKFVKE